MPSLMKGKVWHERKHLVEYPVLAEVKYDEIRCHVRVAIGHHGSGAPIEFISYSGKPLANMEGFAYDFAVLAGETGYTEFDCGFEVNANFNDSYRWVRSTKNFPDDLVGASTKFILFDLPENPDPYILRKGRINYVARTGGLSVAESTTCLTESDVDAAFLKAREAGLEGLMIKTAKHTYQRGKRIDGWLKFKNSDTYDGKITHLYEAHASRDFDDGIRKGDPLGRTGSVQLVLEDGSEAAPHGIPHELGRDMHRHPEKYLGLWVEFDCMEKDRAGGYRHPTFCRLRDAKD